MRKTFFVFASMALAVALSPQAAAAATVQCPVANVGNNDYIATNAIDCVYDNSAIGSNNIGNGGGNDDFLNGEGINEGSVNLGSTFGLTWTLICSSGTAAGTCSGLSITNLTGTDADYSVTNTAYSSYALGIKDGEAPYWAVFLLDSTKSGHLSMTGGNFSHFTLYGSGTPTSTSTDVTPVPEPASLLLLSSGLAFAGNRLRKRRARGTATV